jgi:hypothetical protein
MHTHSLAQAKLGAASAMNSRYEETTFFNVDMEAPCSMWTTSAPCRGQQTSACCACRLFRRNAILDSIGIVHQGGALRRTATLTEAKKAGIHR